MKKVLLALTLPSVFFLFGCPIGVDFAPGNPGTEKIDAALIGQWETADADAEFTSVKLTKQDEYSFHASMLKTGEMYGLDETELTVWNTTVDGQKILYTLSGNQYFIYGYKQGAANELKLYDIALLVGGMEAVTSTEAYRQEISGSLKKTNCLKEEKLFLKK